jgi:hypothetical protein
MHDETHETGCKDCERLRVAAWLHAKSDETEDLLKLAAERGIPEMKAAQLAFATKTRVLLEVLARMVETNTMPLKAKAEA